MFQFIFFNKGFDHWLKTSCDFPVKLQSINPIIPLLSKHLFMLSLILLKAMMNNKERTVYLLRLIQLDLMF